MQDKTLGYAVADEIICVCAIRIPVSKREDYHKHLDAAIIGGMTEQAIEEYHASWAKGRSDCQLSAHRRVVWASECEYE